MEVTKERIMKAKVDVTEMERVIQDFAPMVTFLTKRFHRVDVEISDKMQIGYMGVVKAVRSYDEVRGASPATHVYNSIRWELWNNLIIKNDNKAEFEFYQLSLDKETEEDITLLDQVGYLPRQFFETEKDELSEQLWDTLFSLKTPEKNISYTYMFYKKGISQKEIALKEGVSKQMVSRRIKDTVKLMSTVIDKEIYMDYLKGWYN